MDRIVRALIAVVSVAWMSCGSAAGRGFDPPYATLRGAITSSSVATPSNVHVALVWTVLQGGGFPYSSPPLKATQDLGLVAQFPVEFQMDVTQLPPAEAMSTPQDGNSFALGELVVYEDANGNGQLDLIPADAASSPDVVLGVPSDYWIIYYEGTPPPATSDTEGTLAQGFNIFQVLDAGMPVYADAGDCLATIDSGVECMTLPDGGVGPCFSWLPPDAGAWEDSAYPDGGIILPTQAELCETGLTGERYAVLPTSTEIPIQLTASPQLAQILCDGSGTASNPPVCTTPLCAQSIPAGAQVTCSSDGLSYRWLSCPSTLCAQDCLAGGDSVSSQAEEPPGWPCP